MKKALCSLTRSLVTENSSLMKIGLIQLFVTDNKEKNVKNAVKAVVGASKKGAELVVLPECFNSPYGALQNVEGLEKYAEDFSDSESLAALSEVAKQEGIVLVGGSIPTLEDEKYYNTSCTFDQEGKLIAKHQKVHLFDIDIPGKIVYQESAILTGGSQYTTFKFNDEVKVGLGICFDIRFAELAQLYQRQGCNLLIYPGAFNMTTGPVHWKLLCQARSVDNQCFVSVCSPARDEKASYVAWGHSMVCDPWGEVLVEADEKERILIVDLDFSRVETVREQLPVVKNKEKFYTVDVTEKLKKKK